FIPRAHCEHRSRRRSAGLGHRVAVPSGLEHRCQIRPHPEQLAADLVNADAIVVRSATKVTAALIEAAPKLRAIARAGTGVDNVDVNAASARGIVVMNAPGSSSISVAELTSGLMLSLARHLPAADAAMKQGKWEK